jgi:hypothetical protein
MSILDCVGTDKQKHGKQPAQANCMAPKVFDFYAGHYYLENSELSDDLVPVVMAEHLVNAPVACNKPKIVKRPGYRDQFHVVELSQRKENLKVLATWEERFADRNLREEGDEILLTQAQLTGRRIVDRPGDEATRRNLLARGTTL